MLLALSTSGCGGIRAGGAVSPATFLLPGLIQADPPPASTAPTLADEPTKALAQAR